MNLLHLLAFIAKQGGFDYCAGAPTINSVTNIGNVWNTCPTGWVTTWQVNITGSLKATQEYYWEVATNEAGDNWSYHSRGTSTSIIVSGVTGSNGTGLDTIEYAKVRCYIVPEGAGVEEACSGPVTSSQESQSGNLCE